MGRVITKKQMDALYANKCSHCGGTIHPSANGFGSIDLNKLLNKAIDNVYKDKADNVKTQLAQAYAGIYSNGVNEGNKQTLFSVAWESPDWDMIRHLESNVYHFSFAKTNEQLKALTAALYSNDGKIVPFDEFKDIASRINNEFGVNHLKTEYNTAIAGGQMSSRWVQFENEKEDLPMLTYQTVGDDRVRPAHAELDNVSRPVDDAFWKTYYPPNGWNCRCDVIQGVARRATPLDTIATPDDVPAMFRTNLAADGVVFPAGHPFFDHLPASVTEAANDNNPFAYEKVFKGKKGGYIYDNAIRAALPEEMTTAKILANKGDKVIFLPEVPSDMDSQRQLRALCLPASIAKQTINPDAMVNGKIVEFKVSTDNTAESISHLLRFGKKQANTICLRLTADISEAIWKRAIKGRVKLAKAIEEVWLITSDGDVEKMTRAEILNF